MSKSLLTRQQIALLRKMHAAEKIADAGGDDTESELTREKGSGWWLGDQRVSAKLCMNLLRLCLISKLSWGNNDHFEIFVLNEDGRRLSQDPSLPIPIIESIRANLLRHNDGTTRASTTQDQRNSIKAEGSKKNKLVIRLSTPKECVSDSGNDIEECIRMGKVVGSGESQMQ